MERPFQLIKRQFGYINAKYLGLTMNTANLAKPFALSYLWIAWRKLLQGLMG